MVFPPCIRYKATCTVRLGNYRDNMTILDAVVCFTSLSHLMGSCFLSHCEVACFHVLHSPNRKEFIVVPICRKLGLYPCSIHRRPSWSALCVRILYLLDRRPCFCTSVLLTGLELCTHQRRTFPKGQAVPFGHASFQNFPLLFFVDVGTSTTIMI